MAEFTPTVAQMRDGYCAAQNLTRETPAQHYLNSPAPDYGAEFDRGLSAHVDEVRQEQREIDRALHRAYRPEVVAEVAVALGDESDWEQVAAWCGGTIVNVQDPSGEHVSLIDVPDVGAAGEGSWIVQRLDGTFAIRSVVAGPRDVVMTAEELDALPIDTVVVDRAGIPRTKRRGDSSLPAGWTHAGRDPISSAMLADGHPLVIVYRPAPREVRRG